MSFLDDDDDDDGVLRWDSKVAMWYHDLTLDSFLLSCILIGVPAWTLFEFWFPWFELDGGLISSTYYVKILCKLIALVTLSVEMISYVSSSLMINSLYIQV